MNTTATTKPASIGREFFVSLRNSIARHTGSGITNRVLLASTFVAGRLSERHAAGLLDGDDRYNTDRGAVYADAVHALSDFWDPEASTLEQHAEAIADDVAQTAGYLWHQCHAKGRIELDL